jgi:serpin B
MTLNGANGETYSQMKNTLQLSGSSQDEVNQAYLDLNNSLASADPKATFTTANSIWCRQGFSFNQSFLDVNKKYFNASVQSLDFTNQASVGTINSWVSENTNGKITTIINKIKSGAVMYLINAIYFNAEWKYKFDSTLTTSTFPFYTSSGILVKCAMMNQENKFNYYKGSDYCALEMPYGNGCYNMLIILPNNSGDVNQLLNSVDGAMLSQINSGMTMQDVKLYLPRFQAEYSTSLNIPLPDLGMVNAFDPSAADFPNISSAMKLYISDVLHKTYVKVGEEGTEAAAVTAVIMSVTSGRGITDPGIVFRVDHPFIFLITEKNSGAILFAGKIVNPVN